MEKGEEYVLVRMKIEKEGERSSGWARISRCGARTETFTAATGFSGRWKGCESLKFITEVLLIQSG
jgi:hypothetical protein